MKNGFLRHMAAFFMAGCVLFVSADTKLVRAAEDKTETVNVTANSVNGDQNVEVGNITASTGNGLDVSAADGKNADVDTGSITAPDDYGVKVSSQDGSAADIDVNGDVSGGEWGVLVSASDQGSSAEVNVSGDISAQKEGGTYEGGVYVTSSDGASAAIKAGGDVSAGQDGLTLYSDGDGTSVQVTVSGDVEAKDDGAVVSADNGGSVVIMADKDIAAGNSGINISSDKGASVDASVGGDVTAGNIGVNVEATGGDASVEVNGKIDAQQAGFQGFALGDSKVDAKLDGEVTSANENGVHLEAKEGGEISAAVDAGIQAGGTGLDVHSDGKGSSAEATVNADISGKEIGTYMTTSSGAEAEATVNGNVTSDERGAELHASGGGQTNLVIDGDLTGDVVGLYASSATEEGVIDVLVTGTISGGDAGVALDKDKGYSADNLTLTVWKIVPDGEGAVAADYTYNTEKKEDVRSAQNEAFEKTIKYIIKVEQPEEGGSLTAVDKDGKALETSHDRDIAYEGDKVILKINADKGYRVLAAYNGKGEKTELLMDSDGNYYVEVPKGGGVYLSVDMGKEKYVVEFVDEDGTSLQSSEAEYGDMPSFTGAEPRKAATAAYTYTFAGWTPKIDPVTGDITYTASYTEELNKYDLSFDLNGGELEGKTGTVIYNYGYGTTISLPAAPTREGYRFLYWKGSEYKAGADYTVDGAHSFTAVWEKEEKEEQEEQEETADREQSDTPEKSDVPEETAEPAKEQPGKTPGRESGGSTPSDGSGYSGNNTAGKAGSSGMIGAKAADAAKYAAPLTADETDFAGPSALMIISFLIMIIVLRKKTQPA